MGGIEDAVLLWRLQNYIYSKGTVHLLLAYKRRMANFANTVIQKINSYIRLRQEVVSTDERWLCRTDDSLNVLDRLLERQLEDALIDSHLVKVSVVPVLHQPGEPLPCPAADVHLHLDHLPSRVDRPQLQQVRARRFSAVASIKLLLLRPAVICAK